uniref:(northern house mosquito) hypothetical protein n=1 Tax=Culex pipiens TaxID=7175 RepID=A0A8D8BJH8_CULPI
MHMRLLLQLLQRVQAHLTVVDQHVVVVQRGQLLLNRCRRFNPFRARLNIVQYLLQRVHVVVLLQQPLLIHQPGPKITLTLLLLLLRLKVHRNLVPGQLKFVDVELPSTQLKFRLVVVNIKQLALLAATTRDCR